MPTPLFVRLAVGPPSTGSVLPAPAGQVKSGWPVSPWACSVLCVTENHSTQRQCVHEVWCAKMKRASECKTQLRAGSQCHPEPALLRSRVKGLLCMCTWASVWSHQYSRKRGRNSHNWVSLGQRFCFQRKISFLPYFRKIIGILRLKNQTKFSNSQKFLLGPTLCQTQIETEGSPSWGQERNCLLMSQSLRTVLLWSKAQGHGGPGWSGQGRGWAPPWSALHLEPCVVSLLLLTATLWDDVRIPACR